MKYLNGIVEMPFEAAEKSTSIDVMREHIEAGGAYLLRGAVDPSFVWRLRTYLESVGSNSFPNYEPIELGAANSHRINFWDDRSHVKGCFHQFNFYPWNQDILNLFSHFRGIYRLRNLINGLSADQFLDWQADAQIVPRLSVQFYPKAIGALNTHTDPVGFHQLCVPTLVMSEFGKDFHGGGFYLMSSVSNRVMIEKKASIGDLILINAQTPHGVATIDENLNEDWMSFEGRWTTLFAMNKIAESQQIDDSAEVTG